MRYMKSKQKILMQKVSMHVWTFCYVITAFVPWTARDSNSEFSLCISSEKDTTHSKHMSLIPLEQEKKISLLLHLAVKNSSVL